MFNKMSIKNRIIVLAVSLLMIPSLLIGYIGYESAKTELERKVVQSSHENVKLIDDLITRSIAPKKTDMNYLSAKLKGIMQ